MKRGLILLILVLSTSCTSEGGSSTGSSDDGSGPGNPELSFGAAVEVTSNESGLASTEVTIAPGTTAFQAIAAASQGLLSINSITGPKGEEVLLQKR